jgi:hypothetical protein
MTRRQERIRRVLRSLPVLVLAFAAFVAEPLLIGLALAWGIGVIVAGRLHERALNERLKAIASTLARSGDPFVAARNLESLVADSRAYPGFHSVALLFLGIARARGGDAQGALDLLYAVERAGWLAHRVVWLAWLLPWLAQLHAARGELDVAEGWLAVARTKLPRDRSAALVSPESLVLLRRGRNDDAIARIDAYVAGAATDPPLDPRDPHDPVALHFALVRAFAKARAGRPIPHDEVHRLVQARLALPGRAPLPLEAWWDEFASFLDAAARQAHAAEEHA